MVSIRKRVRSSSIKIYCAPFGNVTYIDALQAAAKGERTVADEGDRARDGDARQAAATAERPPADGGDGARDNQIRYLTAV